MMLCRRSLAWHRYVEATEASVPSHSLLLWRACISHRSTTNTSGRQPLRRGRGTYHHPCSSSTRLMLDSSSFRLTSYKTRIVGSGRICGSTSCYLKLDQCRLGLLVVCDFLCNVVVNNLEHQTITLLFFLLKQRTADCIKKREIWTLLVFYLHDVKL
jgi:hypothetical protein